MQVLSLLTQGFRNLKRQKLTFDNGLNILTGENAQGKTNTLEAIYLCSLGKSPRCDKDREMIQTNAPYSIINLEYCSRFGKGNIEAVLQRNGKKSISINNIPVKKIGELMGYLNIVWFSPDELRLIKQGPENRRRFMDIDICQTDKAYYYTLTRFNKILSQRNNLLKENYSLNEIKDMIPIWDAQLSREGAKLIIKRRNFINKLSPIAHDIHYRLSEKRENLSINYYTQIDGDTEADIEENYKKLLNSSFEKDCRLKYTSSGIQRDDIELSFDDISIRTYGSQGQQRTSTLSLKMAETMLMKELTGDYPVLLLDDVLSELDDGRRMRLLQFNSDMQIILTCASMDTSAFDGKIIYVKDGSYEN